MTTATHATSTNRLIAGLPSRQRRVFLAGCERVHLDFARVLNRSGGKIRHVYFPLDGFISQITVLGNDRRLEVGIVGNEGMLGVSLMLGVAIAPQEAVVQGAGAALRMSAAIFQRHCRRSAALRSILHRYTCVLIDQLAQNAACTHYHLIDERLARWLLMTRDRAHDDAFHLTHRFLAYMLGVRRVGISQAASALHRRGLINYSRGRILIVDGPGLEKQSCACYAEGKALYERVLPGGKA